MGRTAHIGEERVAQIRRWAEELGFSGVGFSKAERLETEEPRLAAWLAEERHGRMAYLEKNFDKRLDPRLLLPGTKTVISLLYNHYTDVRQEDPEAPKISTVNKTAANGTLAIATKLAAIAGTISVMAGMPVNAATALAIIVPK